MFLSNPARSFLAILLMLSSAAGCNWLRSDESTATPRSEEPKNRFPFTTSEPENFQCEIIETAGDTVRRKRIAKKGTWRRVDFDYGESNQRTLLQTDKEYLLDIGRGLYAETETAPGGQFSELTQELLNTGQHPEFEETARDGSMVRYTVRPGDGGTSEIVVHYDESIGMPVKQEFFSLENGETILQHTIEMVNFKTEPDAGDFSIPSGFRRVAISQLLGEQQE